MSRSSSCAALTLTVPLKSLALSSVTLCSAAVICAWPPTVSTSLSLTAPPAVTTSLPLKLTVPKSKAVVSRSSSCAALTLTAPLKSLALSSVTLCSSAVICVWPPTVSTPLSLTDPALMMVKSRPTTVLPKATLPLDRTVRSRISPDTTPLTDRLPPAEICTLPATSSRASSAPVSVTAKLPAPRIVTPPAKWLALLSLAMLLAAPSITVVPAMLIREPTA